MAADPVLSVFPLGFPWETFDPFLFCVHHDDAYPRGNEHMGPASSLQGRDIGMDFAGIDGWRMYHGDVVPGFPRHPHRGFETVTIVRTGLIDHSDSLGAAARYGRGDVQWLTAGRGIVHAEMFPLLEREKGNPVELFQIWLNLPAANKLVSPYFAMLWGPTIPRRALRDETGRAIELSIFAGAIDGAQAPSPPPDSWASQPDTSVAIWTIRLDARARWSLPASPEGTNTSLYFFRGATCRIGGQALEPGVGVRLRAGVDVEIDNGDEEAELLLLRGRPIGEPVAAYGPFVMNTPAEIQQAFLDYRRTEFGGWPWPADAPVHPREQGRFARRPDGTLEGPKED